MRTPTSPLHPLYRALPDPRTEPTITVPRGASVVGIPVRTAYWAVQNGDWPSIRVGQRRIVLPTARWLAAVGLSDNDEGPVATPGLASTTNPSTPVTNGATLSHDGTPDRRRD